jgi:hypothetical protein
MRKVEGKTPGGEGRRWQTKMTLKDVLSALGVLMYYFLR